MNERQAYLAIRNAIRLENFSDDIARKIAPELRAIFNELGEQFRTMPPGNIERELWYRQQRLRIADMLAPISREMGQELGARLGEEAAEQMQYAERYLKAAGEDPANLVAAAAPQDGLRVGFDGEGASFGRPQFTRTQLNAITQDVRVMGERLEDLFEPTIGRGEIGPWIRQNLNMIDRKVKTGFLTGQTADQIAAQFPGFGAEAIRRNKAIARTAVMDLSAKANEEFWQANSDVIAGWEYDATMDNRVCEQCAPWDGEFKEQRNSLPAVPLHVNCRCRVLPLTNTEMELRKEEGPQRRSVVELIEAPSKEQAIALAKAKPGVVAARAYAGQVKVNGKKYWRVAKDIERKDGPLTMGEFLKQASPQTQLQVLGSKKRVSRFLGLVGGRDGSVPLSPDLALKRVVEWKPTVSRKPRMSAQMKLDISQLKSQKELMKKSSEGEQQIVYGYLRAKDSGTGKAGSPYYVGIANRYTRAFERHARGGASRKFHDVPVPKDESLVRQFGVFPSRAAAAKREQELIARYGRKGLDEKGILLNRSIGGDQSALGAKRTKAQIARMTANRDYKAIARTKMAKIAVELGIDPGTYLEMPYRQREAMKAWVKAKKGRTAQDYLDWVAGGSKKDQSLRALSQGWAEKVGLTNDQWLAIPDKERANIARRYQKGLRGPALFRNQTEADRRANATATRRAKTAAKYGIPPAAYDRLTKEQRALLASRYARGKRGAALLEGLL